MIENLKIILQKNVIEFVDKLIHFQHFTDGAFQNGLCSGLGIMNFPDGSKYVR